MTDYIRNMTDEEKRRHESWKAAQPLDANTQWDMYRQMTRGDAEEDPASEYAFDALTGDKSLGAGKQTQQMSSQENVLSIEDYLRRKGK